VKRKKVTANWATVINHARLNGSAGGWWVPTSSGGKIVFASPYHQEDHGLLIEDLGLGLGVDEFAATYATGSVRFIVGGFPVGGVKSPESRYLNLCAESLRALKDCVATFPSKRGWDVEADYWSAGGVDLRVVDPIDLGFSVGRRPNPPKNIDTEETLGGECAVWALAAASGRTVQDVRRAFLDAGIDIWTEDGLAKGTELERMRKMVQKLDLEKRITYIGYSYPMLLAKSKRALFHTSRDYTSRFMHGKSADDFARTQAVEDGFQLPPGTMSGANRATVGQVLRMAKRERLAAIVVTGRVRLALRKIEKLASGVKIRHMGIKGVTHVLGYSPSLGVYDTAVSIPNAVAMERFKVGNVKLGDWHRHGQEIPDPSRPALLWVYFKGE
jgi:hypothetical protein